MKTVQIGKGKVQIIQFETLAELQKIFTEKEIVTGFNIAYRKDMLDSLRCVKTAGSKNKINS